MQDRSSVIAIVVILAICILGVYVAVSGFLNSAPPPSSAITPAAQITPFIVTLATDTPAPAKPPIASSATVTPLPVPSPLGAFQTITAAVTPPPPQPTAPRATATPVASPSSTSPQIVSPSCAGMPFCAQGGSADSTLAPTGAECPRNYIWGRVVDATGKGIPNRRITYKDPVGSGSTVETKGPPDPPGTFNIPAPAGNWELWLVDASGNRVSPQVKITMPQSFQGGGNCPSRIDFVQQK